MEENSPRIRRIPLKIAGVLGFGTTVLYLSALPVVDDTSQLPLAWVFVAVNALAGGLAWFADRVAGRERVLAISSSVLFLAMWMVSSARVFIVIYLLATLLAGYGWVGVKKQTEATVEP